MRYTRIRHPFQGRPRPLHNTVFTSAVLGTTSARNSISTRPLGDPPMVISKKTTGFDIAVPCYLEWYVATFVVEMFDGCNEDDDDQRQSCCSLRFFIVVTTQSTRDLPVVRRLLATESTRDLQ